MDEVVRWGVLGAAKFAREHMAPAIHSARGAELTALATRTPRKAEDFQAFCPSLRVHDSYDALVDDPDIDAIYIPLATHLHVEWSIRALKAGKHVLCEKPIAMAEREFDDLIAARDASGCLAAEAYMIVHHPQWPRVRDLVAAGEIGELRHIQGFFTYNNESDSANFRQVAEYGGGGVRDIGVYPIGAARFVTGLDPEKIAARVQYEGGVDTFADINARFGDVTFNAIVGMRLFRMQDMVFHGSRGLIRLTAPFNPGVFAEAQVRLQTEGGQARIERFPIGNQYQMQVEAFCASVRNGVPYPCPLEFSRGTQAVLDGIFKASA